ncbi:hypothetical protein [Sphingobacterium corticibacter]|uniref:Uncharacterized protein n=1 Tax=Sphingobacterium corticibacter TaxID=2171749 RepID=A0A2T8HFX2_9SPHI|nr:hypothetical protein [Sphingobacterium corticibacter]PVH24303.1 hypothetical protein DC487_14560 [Sphingobacterium corticibacter]
MTKIGLVFLLACGLLMNTLNALAQNLIINEETPRHEIIAGTKVSLAASAGYEPATSFTGLQNLETQSTIMVLEVTTPYQQYIAQAIPMVISNDKSTMVEQAQYMINDLPARLYVGTQKGDTDTALFQRIFLVLGNDKETIAFNCHYPYQEGAALDSAIMQTILSVRYHPDVVVDPLKNMGFTINTAGTSFRFSRKTGTALQYMQDGKNNWTPAAFFIDRKFLTTEVTDKTTFILQQVQAIFEVDSVLFSRSLQSGDSPAEEVMANLRSKRSGEITQAYFITRFDTNRAYSMIGYNISARAMEEMKTIFRSLEVQ